MQWMARASVTTLRSGSAGSLLSTVFSSRLCFKVLESVFWDGGCGHTNQYLTNNKFESSRYKLVDTRFPALRCLLFVVLPSSPTHRLLSITIATNVLALHVTVDSGEAVIGKPFNLSSNLALRFKSTKTYE